MDVGDDWETSWSEGFKTDELSWVDSKGSSFVNVDLESVGERSGDGSRLPFIPMSVMKEITAAISTGTSDTHAELYHSGTTCYISPYCNMFKNLTSTPPKSLNTANNGKFMAIGKGD